MRTILRLFSAIFVLIVFTSCDNTDPINTETNPFSNGGDERNMIVVISDMHLGADLEYTECRENLPSLEKLLKLIKAAPTPSIPMI